MIAKLLGELAKPLIDKIPDTNERRRLEAQTEAKAQEIEKAVVTGQLAINREEAKHKSVFVAGWRPACGWICNLCLLGLVCAVIHGHFTGSEYQTLFAAYGTLVAPAHLGLLGLRTIEKRHGTASDQLDVPAA